MALSEKTVAALREGGADYVGDWLCWNEKKLAELPTRKEKQHFINWEGHLQDAAFDMAMEDPITGRELKGIARDCAADWVYDGMEEAVKAYLDKQPG